MNKNQNYGLFGKKAMTALSKLARSEYAMNGQIDVSKFNTDDLNTVVAAKKKASDVADSLENLWNDGSMKDE